MVIEKGDVLPDEDDKNTSTHTNASTTNHYISFVMAGVVGALLMLICIIIYVHVFN